MKNLYINNNEIFLKLTCEFPNAEIEHCAMAYDWFKLIQVLNHSDHLKIGLSEYYWRKLVLFCQKKLFNAKCAGCIVFNESSLLVLEKGNKWEFPKGFIDSNESKEEAALRETQEESGINQLALKGELKPTYHLYQYQNNFTFKTTYWFQAFTNNQIAHPQKDEGFTDYHWIDINELDNHLNKFYPNMLPLISSLLH